MIRVKDIYTTKKDHSVPDVSDVTDVLISHLLFQTSNISHFLLSLATGLHVCYLLEKKKNIKQLKYQNVM